VHAGSGRKATQSHRQQQATGQTKARERERMIDCRATAFSNAVGLKEPSPAGHVFSMP
jgi:hypothetical protein